jgi:hypothetical protein
MREQPNGTGRAVTGVLLDQVANRCIQGNLGITQVIFAPEAG